MTNAMDWTGLDGSNPLAFLAAVGALRTLSLAEPSRRFRLAWTRQGKWMPQLQLDQPISKDDLVALLHEKLAAMKDHRAFAIGDNLNLPLVDFRKHCQIATEETSPEDRRGADFLASFGCDAIGTETNPDVMQDTAFRTMSGSGHQHFLGSFRNIVGATQPQHVEKALFHLWRYDDPLTKLTTRWDPIEDVRYALRWKDPGKENTLRSKSGSMLGANRLAIEALPLFPCAPAGTRLHSTGFRGRRSKDTFFTWPIWETPLNVECVRSVLSLRELQADEVDRPALARRGVVEVFRSQRITVGKFRNFTPARSV